MALDLFYSDYYTDAYNSLGYFSYSDFFEFGIKIGIQSKRLKRIIEDFTTKTDAVKLMIEESFLDADMKNIYFSQYQSRLSAYLYKI
ncbi:hypothetical protein GCM10011514_49830 [Emticicia aquatilis]|uniref:Uncharacterized protein n=1 Tax=Emticicia aquatilis TaxID=1537369 RepID=A0A917DYU2_9BACT|nr:hypothetical protein [Emticicia aquatilis]GGD79877.1 hypothetical protein GCM10011514_49830 [Emticicia aquatilis]